MEYIVIPDTAIVAVNSGKQENESSNLVFRDENGKLHQRHLLSGRKNVRFITLQI